MDSATGGLKTLCQEVEEHMELGAALRAGDLAGLSSAGSATSSSGLPIESASRARLLAAQAKAAASAKRRRSAAI